MASPPVNDSEGLQVNYNETLAAKAPEVVAGNTHHNNYAPPGYEDQPRTRVPFGLGIWTFALVIAAITAIVVGGGVGGGLGAALASRQSCDTPTPTEAAASSSSSPETDSSVTSATSSIDPSSTASVEVGLTDYKPESPSKVETLTLKCPDDLGKGETFKSNRGYDFTYYCGIDAGGGSPAEGGVLLETWYLLLHILFKIA